MASLPQLLTHTPAVLAWLHARGATALTVDSREVARHVRAGQSVVFVAWPGAARDGRAFVARALADGACAALVESDGVQAFDFDDERIAQVPGLKATLAQIAHGFYGEPSDHLDVLAVTGTNGKTSTSWWTAQALSALGRPCGVVGTLGVGQPGAGSFEPTGLTTPDPVTLHATFRRFVDQGLKAAAIEASSIGVEERRLDATRIQVAQFTNFTQDHLDYHGSMQAYWQAKQALFEWPGLRAAVINLDDAQAPALLEVAARRQLQVWTYALHQSARLRAEHWQVTAQGQQVQVTESESGAEVQRVEICTPLIGEFNVANLLCVLGGLRALGVPLVDAARACEALSAVPGRMQMVAIPGVPGTEQPLAVVDYAHTPDALQKALLALKPVVQARSGRLWCVFGCGGNRDPIKRPLMGAMAEQQADEIVLTSDNPRNEAPALILSQILAGVARTEGVAVIENRREAIAHALTQCAANDVVLIAGKGHEATQEVAGVKSVFSDADEALAALQARRVA